MPLGRLNDKCSSRPKSIGVRVGIRAGLVPGARATINQSCRRCCDAANCDSCRAKSRPAQYPTARRTVEPHGDHGGAPKRHAVSLPAKARHRVAMPRSGWPHRRFPRSATRVGPELATARAGRKIGLDRSTGLFDTVEQSNCAVNQEGKNVAGSGANHDDAAPELISRRIAELADCGVEFALGRMRKADQGPLIRALSKSGSGRERRFGRTPA